MLKDFFRKNIVHFVAIIVFLLLAAIYSKPLIFDNKRLNTHDLNVYRSIVKENKDYEKEHDRFVFWNNNLFSGMPTYLISVAKQENIFNHFYNLFSFNHSYPFNFIFWYLLGFYIMLCCFRIDPLVSLVGSIAFAFSSYYFIIIAAGHITKAVAISFIGPIIGGVYLAFEGKKPIAGTFLMSFFLALQILTNHVQISYYTGLIILVFGLFEIINAVKDKYLPRFFKTFGILCLGVVFAFLINAAFLLTVQEYSPYSIRGKSELSNDAHDKTSGLDKSYATAWSYGIDETFTLLVPNAKGGASYTELTKDSHVYNTIVNDLKAYDPSAVNEFGKNVIKNVPTYFGDQSFTSGPVYVGAFIIFLFVLGLLIVKSRLKWWLLSITIISIILSWGSNIEGLTHLLLDYLPGYNKFRTMSMILVIAEVSIPFLGILALVEILKKDYVVEKIINKFYIALGITGLFTMLFIVYPSVFGLSGKHKSEVEMAEQIAQYIPNAPDNFKENISTAIIKDRADLVRNDALRSLIFIILGAAVIFYLIKTKNTKYNKYAIIIIGIIFLADLWTINRRYLNDDNYFTNKKEVEYPFKKSFADTEILKDKGLNYRVCNLSVSTFNDASTSLYHKSIGGYSGAKIRRYQDIHDSIMWREMQMSQYIVNMGYQNKFSDQDIQSLFTNQANTPILNMLNAKYLIINPNKPPILNEKALGNAWFVNSCKFVETPDEELNTLKLIDTKKEAIINKKFEDNFNNFMFSVDSTASISLIHYAPDSLIYKTNSNTDQLAVFSEIYYPHGWKVTIDDQDANYFRANYILRSMIIPKGEHIIKFAFIPEIYYTGVTISYITCAIYFLLFIIWSFYRYRINKHKKITA